MRYIVFAFLLVAVVVVSLAGFRGSTSRRPPLEIFPDMDRQPKLRPQTGSGFFADGLSSRPPVPGTVARGSPWPDWPLYTGRISGQTNFVELNPLPVSAQLLARGRERYQIHCAPCHGAQGDGKGITTRYGMTVIADLHDVTSRRVVQQPDGELFHTITHGKGLMHGYGAHIAIEDRWAIIAYVRALQRSRLGTVEDVPAALRTQLPGVTPAGSPPPIP